MNSCNNRPKWTLSPFEPIYCMSFGCPFEIASAGIKEGRQSCYKTTCLVDYTLKKLSFVLSPIVILCCNIFIRVYHKAIYFLNNTLAFSFILQKIYIKCSQKVCKLLQKRMSFFILCQNFLQFFQCSWRNPAFSVIIVLIGYFPKLFRI